MGARPQNASFPIDGGGQTERTIQDERTTPCSLVRCKRRSWSTGYPGVVQAGARLNDSWVSCAPGSTFAPNKGARRCSLILYCPFCLSASIYRKGSVLRPGTHCWCQACSLCFAQQMYRPPQCALNTLLKRLAQT